MNRFFSLRGRPARSATGFSLIEVLVAVVILATGLLALAALQGALARNSADAKARSAVMAALTSRMSQIRQAPPATGTTWTTATPWVGNAAVQAGTSDLAVVETIQAFRWNGAAFITGAVANPVSAFTRATLQATWTAADGSKSLALASDLSGLIYGDGEGYPVIDPNGSAAKRPIVRRADPGLEAGVIPIAYGTGEDARSSAASNPKPVLVGSTTIVGTQFDVLTYIPEGGDTAIIRRRIDTNLVKCRCTTGLAAADRYSVAGEAQWPTVWDGEKYATYQPVDKSLAPAEVLKAGENPAFAGKNRAQSALCTECCRDRIDTADMPVRFGPEGEMQRYDLNNANQLVPSSAGTFVAACRVIGNDGIYKTAADMYSRQYGLLATRANPSGSASPVDFAKDGRPTDAASSTYGRFVKEYLKGYLTSISSSGSAPTTPAAAQQQFNDFELGVLNTPLFVEIPEVSATDARYLHSRGLYSDFLNPAAITKISKALDTCASTNKLDCLLPRLAFTTINLTELAKWSASDEKLNVTKAGTLLGTSVMQPFGGRTTGRGITTLSSARTSSSLSNSTLAFRADIPFVNAAEANPTNWLTDLQQFAVGATAGSTLPYITVVPTGLLGDSPISRVTVDLILGGTTSCTPGTSDYRCDTAVGNLPGTVGLKVSLYNFRETTPSALPTPNVTCGSNTSPVPRPYQVTYSGLSVSRTEGGASLPLVTFNPITARSIPQTATWNSASLNNEEKLYLNFIGGEKTCPTTRLCSGNRFREWGTEYTALACNKVQYP